MTALSIPFPEEYKNKAFFYLRQKHNGQYDLYVAVLVANGSRLTLNASTHEATYDAALNVVDTNITIENSNENLGDRIETVVFTNLEKPSALSNTEPRIKVHNLQYIDYEDADINDEVIIGNVALDCPYVHIKGMIIGASNTVRPKVIIPTGKDVQGSDNSISSINRRYRLSLFTNSPTSFMQWKYANDIPDYIVGASIVDGHFEAYTTNPNSRKTKVKNKNKTSMGGNGGNGGNGDSENNDPKDWWEMLRVFWRRIFRIH